LKLSRGDVFLLGKNRSFSDRKQLKLFLPSAGKARNQDGEKKIEKRGQLMGDGEMETFILWEREESEKQFQKEKH